VSAVEHRRRGQHARPSALRETEDLPGGPRRVLAPSTRQPWRPFRDLPDPPENPEFDDYPPEFQQRIAARFATGLERLAARAHMLRGEIDRIKRGRTHETRRAETLKQEILEQVRRKVRK